MPDLRHVHRTSLSLAPTYALILSLLFLLSPFSYAADADERLEACAKLENDSARLKCFDDLSGRKTSAAETTPSGVAAETQSGATATQPVTLVKNQEEKPSVLSKQWDLDPVSRKDPFVIRLYRPNYILPAAYNNSPNSDTALDYDRNAEAQNTEAKFQISFKVKLWEDILDRDVDLWFAYTQLSLWQVYNKTFSSPFRESNYEPELLLNFRTDYNLFGMRGRILNIGINHQSNGRGRTLSRSWNRVVATAGFEKDNFNLFLKGWYRLPESRHEDDNPKIMKYMGYGEIWGTYYWQKHRFSAMFRNNLRMTDNKGAIQLDWSFPLPFMKNDRLSGYLQYFNGYGESLLDYDKSTNRIGIGVMLMDWN